MEEKIFKQKFDVLCACLKFPPREENAARIWFTLSKAEMEDEQINRAFTLARNLDEFPSYNQFRTLGVIGNRSLEDDVTKTVGAIIAAFNNSRADASDSSPLLRASSPAIYEALGGHHKWWRVMNGYERAPNEKMIFEIVRASLKDEYQGTFEIVKSNKALEESRVKGLLK